MEQKLLSVLNQIRSEVEQLRGIEKEIDEQGKTSYKISTEFFLGKDRDVQLCFLILLAYKDVFKGDLPHDVIDITILLHKNLGSDSKLHDLWKHINVNLHDSYPQWMELVNSYQLHNYQSEENDTLIFKWMNEEILFSDGLMSEFAIYANFLTEVVGNSSSTFDMVSNGKNILVLGDNCKFYREIFTDKRSFKNITFCPEGNYLYNCVLLNCAFQPNQLNVNLLKRENKDSSVFPFDDARFDIIYSYIEKEEDKDVLDFKSIMSLVEDDGWAVVFGQSQKRLINKEVFSSYDFPLVADYISVTFASNINKMYLCRKKNSSCVVRSLQLLIDGSEFNLQYQGILTATIKAIEKHMTTGNYQELTKEDYLYSSRGDVMLSNIFRSRDQMSFVFREIDDIIMKKTNNLIPKGEIKGGNIIERVSDNPFNIKMSPKYYLEPEVYNEAFSKEAEKSLFRFGEKNNNSYLLEVNFPSEKYYEIAKNLSYGVNDYDKEQTQMECRIMLSSGLLWNGYRSFLKVNASREHPVCYRYCIFCQEDYQPQCQSALNEVEISDEYDEDFIIYQFSSHYDHSKFILVAPTKEEQHAYYLNKKEEYRLKNIDLVNEIREEERKKISIDLHYLKHDASQYLSKISSAKSLFEGRLENGVLNLNDKFRSGNTVKDYLEDIGKCVTHVTKFLEQMTFLTDVLPQKPMEIGILLQELAKCTLTTKNYKVELNLSENLEGVRCLLDERIYKAFDNILSNAERHAFVDKKRTDYKVEINAIKEGDVVIISFANNGTPPDHTLTEEGFFTRGLHVGPTGHSGFGGSIIRETIEGQNGIVHLHINESGDNPFLIEIKLPVYYD